MNCRIMLNDWVVWMTMFREMSVRNTPHSDDRSAESEIPEEGELENGKGVVDETIDDEFRVFSCKGLTDV